MVRNQKINLPGKYEVKPGHTMIISTTLPEDYNETSIAIRSSLQDVKFYVDNTLRKEYSTKDTRLAGQKIRRVDIYFAPQPIRMQEKHYALNLQPILLTILV